MSKKLKRFVKKRRLYREKKSRKPKRAVRMINPTLPNYNRQMALIYRLLGNIYLI